MAKILLVEDDTLVGKMVRDWLSGQQHVVELVTVGDEAAARLKLYSYDLIVLDWDLPVQSGLDVCKQFRASGGTSPVLMLTANDTIDHKEEGLYSGADDYLTKPFALKELSARIAALLRRPAVFRASNMQVGKITLDSIQHKAFVDGIEIPLLPKEYALLELLLKHPNELFSTQAILEKIWSSESDTTASVIKAHVSRLRKKLEHVDDPTITTVHGLGYRLVVNNKS